MSKNIAVLAVCALVSNAHAAPTPVDYDAAVKGIRETLTGLVKSEPVNPPGNEARAVAVVAERLKKEGIPFEVIEFDKGRANIVARMKGSGAKKPLLLLAHLDVVGVKDQAWTVPANVVTEKDGYLYGRGILDDLGMAAVIVETLVLLKNSKQALDRDVVMALTGAEETGGEGVRHLLDKKPELINDAEIALNEGGSPTLVDGQVKFIKMQVGEKIYQDFKLTAKGETGHSSVPKKNNAIYKLARALDKLGRHEPEYRLIPATRAYFTERAKFETPDQAKAMTALVNAKGKLPKAALEKVKENPIHASILSTTCVATMVSGGTKENALPPEASANVNCRLLPDETLAQAKERLEKVIGDKEVEVSMSKEFGAAEASPVTGVVPDAVREISQQMWPGTSVIPSVQTGATDSRFLRRKGILAYGVGPIAISEPDGNRAHGIDERIPVASLRPGIEYFHKIVLKLAAAPASGETPVK